MVGDGNCDKACKTRKCFNDLNDCKDQRFCAYGCFPDFIGDGVCDSVCYTKNCKWDIDDCKELEDPVNKVLVDSCNKVCNKSMIGDGKCDEVCNNRGCAYDFGDCLLYIIDPKFGRKQRRLSLRTY